MLTVFQLKRGKPYRLTKMLGTLIIAGTILFFILVLPLTNYSLPKSCLCPPEKTTNIDMANYRKILEHVKTSEGGYSADPEDNALKFGHSGVIGLDRRYPNLPVHTYRGVTWASWREYARRKGFTATGKSFVDMTISQWEDLLKTMYWDAILGDQIKSQGIAEIIFEAIWGGGSATLIRDLQNFLRVRDYNIRVDGAIGPKTVGALNDYTKKGVAKEEELIRYLTNERLKYLQGLNDWWKYKVGWTNRLLALQNKAIAYLSDPVIGGGTAIAVGAAALGVYLLSK
jgi:lysozyme family protein